jgi:hypothetical protein
MGRGPAQGERGKGPTGKGDGPREREEEFGLLGWAAALFFFPFFFLFPFHTQAIQTIPFEFKFEFKPYTLNTKKTMLQHECTNMLTL